MKIRTLLPPEHIFLKAGLEDKQAVLRFIADSFGGLGVVRNTDNVHKALKTREEMMSTGIGNGIGIPHALTPEAEDIAVLLISLAHPIPFDSLDGAPVDIVIALIVPQNETTLHLRTLAGISGLCKRPGFLEMVRQSRDSRLLWENIRNTEDG
ncbi:PTS IIA-like nitrogen-regulatory protein PtsN [Desulfonema ishimotonii]|uniref:PTS IIA-like nitrogen-regulatory protein PtsN n=1 Tax=Desulfonema ishimotonii TaxID=45657 RepID=A0A401FX80_9BACT|nr:PTS sugar transporter subunit IIA [Desulfonema ishimotonii]GBC61598.1 PTS IIA-like nitrogen-regulatory protein PtsN [Desulfonema ishimotonii]